MDSDVDSIMDDYSQVESESDAYSPEVGSQLIHLLVSAAKADHLRSLFSFVTCLPVAEAKGKGTSEEGRGSQTCKGCAKEVDPDNP